MLQTDEDNKELEEVKCLNIMKNPISDQEDFLAAREKDLKLIEEQLERDQFSMQPASDK